MESLSHIMAQYPELKRSPEHWSLSKDAAWWVDEQSQALIDHIKGGYHHHHRHSPMAPSVSSASMTVRSSPQDGAPSPSLTPSPDAQLAGRMGVSLFPPENGNQANQARSIATALVTEGGTRDRSVAAKAGVRMMLSMCLPGMAHQSVVDRLMRESLVV